MKRQSLFSRIALCASLILLIGAGSRFALRVSARPYLVCDQPTFAFGEIVEGEVVEHTFRLRNEGAKALRIIAVESDCSCTTVTPPEKMVVEPNGATEVFVRFKPTLPLGPQRQVIFVHTTDSKRPGLLLHLVGNLRAQ